MTRAEDALELTPDQRRAWMQIAALTMMLPQLLDAQLKRDAGLNGFEYGILAALADADRRTLQMSELAAWSQGSLSRLSHAVSRLETQAWVERSPSPDGGRRTDVRLTRVGLRHLDAVTPAHSREVRRLIAEPLTSRELETMARIATKLLRAIDADAAAALERRLDL